MHPPETPRDLGSLSTAWIDEALRSAGVLGESKVLGFDLESVGKGEGFLGEIARLHLHYQNKEPTAPASLIVKIPTGNRRLRAVGESMALYEREILFYSQLADRLPIRTPRCYFAQMDPRPFGGPALDAAIAVRLNHLPRAILRGLIALAPGIFRLSRRRYALLLEDLGSARLGDQLSETPEADILAAVTALARIHAECWNDAAAARLPWLHSLDSTARIFGALLVQQRRHFAALFANSLSDEAQRLLDWLEVHLESVHKQLARRPCTLLHGDYRLDNLFFDDSSADPAAIVADWQLCTWGPGVCDLAYFLGSTLDENQDPTTALRYISHYHCVLADCGVRDYSLEECRRDYSLALLFAVGRLVSSITEIESADPRAGPVLRAWIQRAFAALRGIEFERLL